MAETDLGRSSRPRERECARGRERLVGAGIGHERNRGIVKVGVHKQEYHANGERSEIFHEGEWVYKMCIYLAGLCVSKVIPKPL